MIERLLARPRPQAVAVAAAALPEATAAPAAARSPTVITTALAATDDDDTDYEAAITAPEPVDIYDDGLDDAVEAVEPPELRGADA